MSEFARELARRRCPRCKKEGTLHYQPVNATIACKACLGSYIDPFEEGPWDKGNGKHIIDTADNNVVSSYQVKNVEGVDPIINKNVVDFYRYLRDKGSLSEII